MASKAFIVICDVELGKPYMLPESPGRDPVRVNNGIEGRGIGKKRMTSCNEAYMGSKFALYSAPPKIELFGGRVIVHFYIQSGTF